MDTKHLNITLSAILPNENECADEPKSVEFKEIFSDNSGVSYRNISTESDTD